MSEPTEARVEEHRTACPCQEAVCCSAAPAGPADPSVDPGTSSTELVVVRQVTVRFAGTPILEGIDLSFGRDAFIAIIGPNGGGKSTLLRIILGLVPPDEGQVLLWGEPPHSHRHRVGYVPQFASFRQSFPITVEEVVAMGRLYQRSIFARRRPEDRDEVERALQRMGLQDKRRRQASS
ncbi:MAG: ATP-binding cassette domain-containing protein, partial [Deltaproteobacteria bacterium]|nr:ATP-binding cassette domain-containing protein [Deltaproteobacteria bacterium]